MSEYEQLMELGFSRNEAKVYFALLEHGPMGGAQIASATGMYRTTVYDTLKGLREGGLASAVVVESKKKFQAASPQALRDLYQFRLSKLDAMVERLEAQRSVEAHPANVQIYHGKRAVLKAYRDILAVLIRTRVTHLGMGIDERYFINEDPFLGKWFITSLEKHGLKEKMITFEGAVDFAGGKTTEYRAIPLEHFDPTFVLIDADLVTIILWTAPRYVIQIRSRDFAKSYRKQFDLMWKHGKRIDWKSTVPKT